MELEVSTPALLFPAVSLLFLSYTNRFLHLSALIRQLHRDSQAQEKEALGVWAQIDNLRRRLVLIRWMQLHGALSLALCVISMAAIVFDAMPLGFWAFGAALLFMAISLISLLLEIWMSGGALRILLSEIEQP